MSSYKSSNSLQNSVYSFSFSKQPKFNGVYKKGISDTIYNLPDGKSTRYASQGFGNRVDLTNPYGKGSPAPNSYRIKSCFDNSLDHKKGPLILERFTPLVIYNIFFYIFFIAFI